MKGCAKGHHQVLDKRSQTPVKGENESLRLPEGKQEEREHYREEPHSWIAAARRQLNSIRIFEDVLQVPTVEIHCKKLPRCFILDV